jgi:hypothetical protein
MNTVGMTDSGLVVANTGAPPRHVFRTNFSLDNVVCKRGARNFTLNYITHLIE